ncbi:hypothetical protein WA1_10460 [Scytonema hofmannii PCC 7110]|uniref:Uncharacterized protein n=1 Tax=Scytonema hofmannii PCC 7110 TaxID=128403 RepID=A0A139XFN1_9CYAN|nr:hypothetical protein [Scytonema hofmannii]KYC43479.1 hypothetical protein WA1_10460 [Scytonema hofmannii PCC 7110]
MFLLSGRNLILFFATCLCMLGVSSLQMPRMQKLLHSNKTVPVKTLQRELDLERTRLNLMEKIPSFGYDNVIANFAYLWFLQYFGDDEVRSKTNYSLSPQYFEIILARDPRFITAYLGLSTSTSMYAAMPEYSIKLMEKGLKSLSPFAPTKSYYVWRYKGIDELLFLGQSLKARQSFEKTSEWASHHSDEESKQATAISKKTAEFLSRNPNSTYARIATWAMVLNNQVDDKTRQRAIREIQALGGDVTNNTDGTHKIKLPEKD